MIRGVSRRSIFDGETDARLFSGRIEKIVEQGELEIMSFCLMPNHAHLIIRSPHGALGDAMRDVESVYVRRFNRPRDRKGHLVEGRYRAKPIRSGRYMSAAVAYIDQNAVEARLVAKPADYPHGSARHYARLAGPPWLDRSWVEAYLRQGRECVPYSPDDYARVFGTRTSASARRWFAAAMAATPAGDSSLDELIAASPEHVLQWMEDRVRSADGTGRGVPLADAESVVACVAGLPLAERSARMDRGGRSRSVERVLAAGLLLHLAGSTQAEIGSWTGQSTSSGRLCVREHDRAVLGSAWYRELVGRVSRSILDGCHPPMASCGFVSDTSC